MKAVFADTFYWVALSDPSDPRYREAVAAEAEFAGVKIVTTDEVLSEFLTFFAGDPWLRARAVRAVQGLLNNPGVTVISQSRETFLSGLDLYRQRPDKGYSLTDCISMQTMRREEISAALTNDRHFEQEGFRAVFRAVSSAN
jgi:predicted nucleic acid-binding protein